MHFKNMDFKISYVVPDFKDTKDVRQRVAGISFILVSTSWSSATPSKAIFSCLSNIPIIKQMEPVDKIGSVQIPAVIHAVGVEQTQPVEARG